MLSEICNTLAMAHEHDGHANAGDCGTTPGPWCDMDVLSVGLNMFVYKEFQRNMEVDNLILRSLICCRSAKL
jgi:hypothetical protein